MWLVILAFLIADVNSCSPGAGKITTTPTFSFSFYPPIPWTYTDILVKTSPGQWINAADARRTLKNDIDSAMAAALKKSGYEGLLSSTRYTTSGYNADQPFPIGTDPGDYIVELGAVTKQVIVLTAAPTTAGSTPTTAAPGPAYRDNIQTFQLKVANSPVALSTDQWSKLARDAYSILNVRYRVRFVSEITVTA